MSEPSKKFILKHTFKSAVGLTSANGPTEKHFGYGWFLSIKNADFGLKLEVVRETKKDEMPPVTVLMTAILKSSRPFETIRKEMKASFCSPVGRGWSSIAEWSDIINYHIVNDELTVEVHVEILKIYTPSSVRREFTMQHTIDHDMMIAIMCDSTPVETHFDVPWKLMVKRELNSLKVNVVCEKEKRSNLWFIDAMFTFKLKNADGNVFVEQQVVTFDKNRKDVGDTTLASWTDTKVCMVDKKVVVEVVGEILDMRGMGLKRKITSFEDDDGVFTDVCLVVGEKKFFVSKAILAEFSSVFKTMFSGEFVETKSKEIVIEDVDAASFEIFLSFIYSRKPNLTSEVMDNLLALADRYDVPRVTEKCVKFLIKSNEVDARKKMELSERFELPDLQEHVLDSLKTGRDLKALQAEMGTMSAATSSALLDKAMSFIRY